MDISKLETSERAWLVTAITKALQCDETLGQIVKTWTVYDGKDKYFPQDVKPDLCPFVIIEPSADQAEPVTIKSSSAPIVLRITLAVKGTNRDHIINLWSQIERVLFPGDGFMLSVLQEYNATTMTLEQPAFAVNLDADARMLFASGAVRIYYRARTML